MKIIHFCALVILCSIYFAPLHTGAAVDGAGEGATAEILPMSELGQVKNETGDPAYDWLTNAFIFYANWYLEPVSHVMTTGEPPQSVEDNPFPPIRIDATYSIDGSSLSYKVYLRGRGPGVTERTFGGPPENAAVWLADLRTIIEEFVPSGIQSGLSMGTPTSSTEALKSFVEASRSTDPKQAAKLFQECLYLDPLFLEAHWRLGITLFSLENYIFAYDHFEAFSLKQPDFGPAVHNMGLCLLKSGKTHLAAEQFQKLVSLEPEFIESRYLLARTLFDAGLHTDAARTYQSIHDMNPSEYRALLELAFIRGLKGDNSGAREASRAAEQIAGKNAVKELNGIGQHAWGSGDLEGALSTFSLVLYLDPGHFPSRLARGVISYQKGDYDAAILEFLEATRLKDDDPDLFRYLGMSYERIGKQNEASGFFRTSSDLFTSHGPTDTVKNMIFNSLTNTANVSDTTPPLRHGRRAHTLTSEWFKNMVMPPPDASDQKPADIHEEQGHAAIDTEASENLSLKVFSLEKELEDLRLQNSRLSEKLKETDEHLSSVSDESSARATELETLKVKYEELNSSLQSRITFYDSLISEKDTAIAEATSALRDLRAQSESALAAEAAKIEKLSADLVANQDASSGLTKEIESLKAELTELRETTAKKEVLISDLEKTLTTRGRVIEESESTISSLKKDLQDTEAALSALGLDLDARRKEVDTLSRSVKDQDEQIASLKKVISAQEDALAAFRDDTEHAKNEIPKLKTEIAAAETLISSLREEMSRKDSLLKSQKTTLEKLASKLEAERIERDERITSLTKKLENSETESASLEKNMQSLEERVASLQNELAEKKSDLEKSARELSAGKKAILTIEEKHAQALDSLKQKLEERDSLLEAREAAIVRITSDLEDERKTTEALKEQQSVLTDEKSAAENSLLSLQEERTRHMDRIREKDDGIASLNGELEKVRESIVKLRDQLKAKDAEIAGLGNRFQSASSLVTALEATIETDRAKMQSLKDAASELERQNREASLRIQALSEEKTAAEKEFERLKATWTATEENHRKLLSASLFQAAEAHHARGEDNEALYLLEALLGFKPGHADALYLLGTISLSRGEYSRASDYFEKSREVYGNFIQEGSPETGGP